MQQKVEDIFNYLNENTTPEEQKRVEKWISESSENDRIFEEVSKLHSLSGDEVENFNPNVVAAWEDLSGKLFVGKNDNVIKVNFGLIMKLAAMVVLSVGLGYFLLNQETELVYKSIATSSDQIQKIELADGSQIWINENTTLKYPESFADDKREVYLKGEAYFDVSKNPDKPFIIRSKNTYTQVLGTSFNLRTTDEASEVNVVSGKVALVHNSDKENKVVLVKGESATLENGLIKKSKVFDINSSAWKTRKLVFESANMVQVVAELKDFYSVEITYDTNLSNCLITSTFENKTLDEVLEVLKVIAQIENEFKDNVYQLSGPGC